MANRAQLSKSIEEDFQKRHPQHHKSRREGNELIYVLKQLQTGQSDIKADLRDVKLASFQY